MTLHSFVYENNQKLELKFTQVILLLTEYLVPLGAALLGLDSSATGLEVKNF